MSNKVLGLDLLELIWLPVEFRPKQNQFHVKLVFLILSVLGRQSAPSRIWASPSSAGIGEEGARALEKSC